MLNYTTEKRGKSDISSQANVMLHFSIYTERNIFKNKTKEYKIHYKKDKSTKVEEKKIQEKGRAREEN